jgi:membrane protein YqaA with SNARE-associated domain
MDLLHQLIDFIAHIDVYLQQWVQKYDNLTYLLLALIIFCETGLVFTPFLPGDSLLFAAGALAGAGSLSLGLLIVILFAAAFIGDNTNYFIGNFVGHKIVNAKRQLIKKEYLDRTHSFYEKHGGKNCNHCPLYANHPHLCTFCGRTWLNDIQKVFTFLRSWKPVMDNQLYYYWISFWKYSYGEAKLYSGGIWHHHPVPAPDDHRFFAPPFLD